MGDRLVLFREELASRYSNLPSITQILELTPEGGRDLSYMIFGSLEDEDVILDKNHTYLITCVKYGSGGLLERVCQSLYQSMWYGDGGSSASKKGFLEVLYKALTHKKVNTYWKGTHGKKGFTFPMYSLASWGELAHLNVVISTPEGQSPQELADLLDVENVEDFDTRNLLYDPSVLRNLGSEDSRYIKYLLKSPILRIGAPLVVCNDHLVGVLSKLNSFRRTDSLTCPPFTTKVGEYAYILMKYLREDRLRSLCPDTFIRSIELENTSIWKGQGNLLEDIAKGLTETPVRDVKGIATSRHIPNRSTLLTAEFLKTLPEDKVDLYFYDCAKRSASSLSKEYNSLLHTRMGVSKLCSLILQPSIRWKGNRKEGEKLLGGYIRALNFVLNDKSLLRGCITNNFYTTYESEGTAWILGRYLDALAPEISSILSLSTCPESMDSLISSQKGGSYLVTKLLKVYVNFPNRFTYTLLIKEYINCLYTMCITNNSVKNTLEKGFQTSSSGHLFWARGNLHLRSSQVQGMKFPPDHGVIEESSSFSFLGDLKFLLQRRDLLTEGDLSSVLGDLEKCLDHLKKIYKLDLKSIEMRTLCDLEQKGLLEISNFI